MDLYKQTIIVIAAWGICYSQIGSVKIEETQIAPKYDSTVNFLGDNPQLYVGADLFLPGKPKELRGYGYKDFKTQKAFNALGKAYKCCAEKSKFNSNYSLLAGTTFKVIDVSRKVHKAIGGGTVDIGDYIFTLQNKKDKSVAYFKYNTEYKHSFPFIDMRFFNKIKQLTMNRNYIVKENSFDIGQPIMSVNGKLIDSVWTSLWKCTDVIVEEKYYTLSLLLENIGKDKIVFHVDNINDEQYIIPAEKSEIYKNDFGEFWDVVLQNKVRIGMNEQMVQISWGKPKNINQTLVEGAAMQQWVYGTRNYVYFKNGIVEAIQ